VSVAAADFARKCSAAVAEFHEVQPISRASAAPLSQNFMRPLPMFCVNDAQAVKSISHLPNQQMSCKMSAMATTAQVKNLYGCIQAERFLTGLNVLKGKVVPPYITPRTKGGQKRFSTKKLFLDEFLGISLNRTFEVF